VEDGERLGIVKGLLFYNLDTKKVELVSSVGIVEHF
jgi:hypothetical protein